MAEKTYSKQCFDRAQYIWWHVGPSIIPAELLTEITETDEEFSAIMHERESILTAAHYAVLDLYNSAKNIKEHLCTDIESYGDDVLEKADEFKKKTMKMRDEYKTKNPEANNV